MSQNLFSLPLSIILVLLLCLPSQGKQKPDIVFIIVDDLNDYVGYLGGHPQGHSPNIDSLASQGMIFPNAYCNSPQCRPSRISLCYGISPHKTGTYFNAKFPNETRIASPSLPEFFHDKGYRVATGGKVFHGNLNTKGITNFPRPKDPKPPKGKDLFNPMSAPNDGSPLNVSDSQMGDFKVADWAIQQWNTPSSKPLFISAGFYRPHRPLQVPQKYFDLFPLQSIQQPSLPKGDDWSDLPQFARQLARSHAHKPLHNGLSDHELILQQKDWTPTLQAYLASIAFVDQQIGRLLKTLENNPRGRETIILLVSDHGWHLGEKKHWCKAALWEQTTKIPFIIKAPGITPNSKCSQPVSLIDVFPTFAELAGFEVPTFLDGTSIKPQLHNPTEKRPPALSFYGEGNTSVRTEQWRYIRYEDGSEELYDHHTDPNEWHNLAQNPKHSATKKHLASFIPQKRHPGLKVQSWFDQYQKKSSQKLPSK